ncbi:MAG: non-lysosomal glucosylceramidase [Bryobacterales bacterium]|nr:non-lysosomal glucosylceramidase [Bryobacterales bacterium]MEB2361225.1 GH116 family glycosyl-hydrolase [Bryobacterales bacterium]
MKRTKGPGRRRFLQTVALAGGIPSGSMAQEAGGTSGRAKTGAAAPIEYPRVFTGARLARIAFPLGGIGAGTISLGGRGQLRDWEIFNRPDKGKSPQYAFPSIWVKGTKGPSVVSVLEAALRPPYEGSSGLGTANVPGLPRLESAVFTGEYPLARVDFRDQKLPVLVSLEAFSPFFPLDANESGLPVAVLRYHVTNPAAAPASVAIAFSVDNPVGTTGRTNEFRKSGALEGIFMQNPFLAATDPLAGSFALSVLAGDGGRITHLRGWRGGTGWRVGPLLFWDDFSADGDLGPEEPVRDSVGSLCLHKEIGPRASADFTFLLSWRFPNRTPERCGWNAVKGEEKTNLGNWYCTRFPDAWKAAEYAATNLERLEKRTREFVEAIRGTTVPAAVRDAATANLSTFASTTCFRTADGEFHTFEGSNDQRGCCFGNCTHVWNYEAATPHLFPSLSRSLRDSAFGFCTDEQGLMDFRQLLPAGKQRWGSAAADGQMGAIMKLYLDWRLSGDTEWLSKHWPAAKRALEFSWIAGGWDADRDGVMEGCQHNTYDVEFFGPNPLCEVWYLGALRAATEMARAVGDEQSAATYNSLFEGGSKWTDANLFNGEYYIQKIQGIPKDRIAKGLTVGMGSAGTENPDFQVGDGCLVDQLVGQFLAHVAGLGNLLDPSKMRKSLQSVMKYNYKENLYQHTSVQRIYALNDEAALVICDYGAVKRPRIPFPYFAEAWTGLEYAIASLMIYQGLVDEGLKVVESARRRHDGERRNPWNEPECGHHYARALSAWGLILACNGFLYDTPRKHVEAKPRIRPDNFTSFWSTGTGWGVFSQMVRERRLHFTLSLRAGNLACRSVQLRRTRGAAAGRSEVTLAGKVLPHRDELRGRELLITLSEEVRLGEGDTLTIVA